MWQQADYEGILSYLSQVDWQSIMSHNLTPDSLWSSYCNILQSVIDLYLPVCSVNPQPLNSFTAKNRKRYPRSIKQAMSKKRCLWHLHRQQPNDSSLYDQYRNTQTECRQLISDFEARRETTVVESNNLGRFCRLINKR